MRTKYGLCPNEMTHKYFSRLHNQIHWLLVYKEEEFPELDNYFSYLLFQINGLTSILCSNPKLFELIILLESAKLEAQKEHCNHKLFRKAILDSHTLIDEIEGDVANV